MNVTYTDESFESLDEISQFLLEDQEWTLTKLLEFRAGLLDKADDLMSSYGQYQLEEYLGHLGKGHRRRVEGHVKIIYKVEGECVYVTDFFDTRQDPSKMKG